MHSHQCCLCSSWLIVRRVPRRVSWHLWWMISAIYNRKRDELLWEIWWIKDFVKRFVYSPLTSFLLPLLPSKIQQLIVLFSALHLTTKWLSHVVFLCQGKSTWVFMNTWNFCICKNDIASEKYSSSNAYWKRIQLNCILILWHHSNQ